jgi:hypothetical protein
VFVVIVVIVVIVVPDPCERTDVAHVDVCASRPE